MKLSSYLEKYADLKTLHKHVKSDFGRKGLVHHNWNHILRDLARAILIGEREGASMKIVLASVILHDIGRLYSEVDKDHHVAGERMAPRYLSDADFSKSEVDRIVHCVKAHGPRGLEAPRTVEAKVCFDAEVLSCSVGYVGVARVFDFFMREEKMGVKDMVMIPSGRRGRRQDFYTRTGRAIGQAGLEKAREFWKELRRALKEEERSVKKTVPEYKGD